MFTQSKLRVFLPMMLIAFLFFGAVSAEAGDRYHRNDGNRAAKGAAVGAAVGALVQIFGGRTEGGQLLKGAVVGGVLGAAVGASQDGRRDRYGRYDNRYRNGYYDQSGYYVQVDGGDYPDTYNQDGYYPDTYNQDGYYQGGYEPGGYDHRYDSGSSRDSRYGRGGYDHDQRDRRSSHRHSSNCGHR